MPGIDFSTNGGTGRIEKAIFALILPNYAVKYQIVFSTFIDLFDFSNGTTACNPPGLPNFT